MDACDEPSADAVAAAVAVLRALKPKDLERAAFAPLRDAGCRLFRRQVMKEAFGGDDIKAFLEEKTRNKQMLRDLEKLDRIVSGAHRRERIHASECGLNEARRQTLELIKAESAEEPRAASDTPRITWLGEVAAAVSLTPTATHSVRVVLSLGEPPPSRPSPPAVAASPPASGVSGGPDPTPTAGDRAPAAGRPPPQGDLRRICNVCRGDCTDLPRHPFYHQLCPRCGDFNWEKASASPRPNPSL